MYYKVIPYSSNHPSNHKFTAFNYILDRTYRLPLNNEENYKELLLIKTIAKNNGYDMEDIAKVYKKPKRENNNNLTTLNNIEYPHLDKNKTWIKFTYFANDIRILTKIFINTSVRVAFGVNNTIKNKCSANSQIDKYNQCGVYSLKCLSCDQVHVGQNGRSFKARYEEHISDIRHNGDKSKYALHMLQRRHEYGKIEETMDILKVVQKGKRLDVLERFYM
jgi:hypothetical protein